LECLLNQPDQTTTTRNFHDHDPETANTRLIDHRHELLEINILVAVELWARDCERSPGEISLMESTDCEGYTISREEDVGTLEKWRGRGNQVQLYRPMT